MDFTKCFPSTEVVDRRTRESEVEDRVLKRQPLRRNCVKEHSTLPCPPARAQCCAQPVESQALGLRRDFDLVDSRGSGVEEVQAVLAGTPDVENPLIRYLAQVRDPLSCLLERCSLRKQRRHRQVLLGRIAQFLAMRPPVPDLRLVRYRANELFGQAESPPVVGYAPLLRDVMADRTGMRRRGYHPRVWRQPERFSRKRIAAIQNRIA